MGLAALFPSERQTPLDTGWVQIEASPGSLALASSNIEGQAVRASCRLPPPPPQRLQKRLSSAHPAPCPKLRRHLPSPEKGEEAPLVCVSPHGNMEWELVFPPTNVTNVYHLYFNECNYLLLHSYVLIL